MNKKRLLVLAFSLFSVHTIFAQQVTAPAMCRASEQVNAYYDLNPDAKAEQTANEAFTEQYLAQLSQTQGKSTAVDTYRVAVVFHVYGTSQGGFTINDALIKSAVAKLNEDFHGLNNDYNSVHSQFMPKRSTKNIKFYLAKKKPDGSPTTGIVYYPTKYGYGNSTATYTNQVSADAWDNYKYINVYVQHELYDNGDVYQSGVAWYPNTGMSNSKLARIVYNGAYLSTNTDPEFASVLTHEFGHFFNLIHTFDGGCTTPNDNVADTPPCTTAQGCHTNVTNLLPLNCNGQLVNSDNYMDYNICYKMFTQGQAARMDAALQMPSRITLWQDSTLIATGIYNPTSVAKTTSGKAIKVYPNPTNGEISIEVAAGTYDMIVTDVTGRIIYQQQANAANGRMDMSIAGNPSGIYFVQIKGEEVNQVVKVQLQ